ncbi:MAG TPA: glycosyltransferase family 2 protein [Candidatus Paceibacterota bacterium]
MEYSVIIPVYNEEGNLDLLYEKLLGGLRQLKGDAEILFVDDGSSDSSFADLTRLAKADKRITVIRFGRNFGKSAAMTAGFKASTGKILINLDADLQDDPTEIPRMVAKLHEGFDFVIGWRKIRHDPIDKTWPSKIFNSVVSKWSGVPLHDFNCGFKVYRRAVLEDIPLYSDMHRLLPLLAAKRGFMVAELAVEHHKRHAGVSKYGMGRTIRGLLDFVSVLFLTTYLARPMHFFGSFGFVSIVFGCITGLWMLVLKFGFSVHFVNTPLPLVTVFLIVIGIQFILLGLIAEMLTRTYHEMQDKPTFRIAEKIHY